uniref:Uncharacterized protein n=1 Tax=Anguilla anguilla TaxID=7936 RepID=A0A0E9RA57_ANGAN
MINITIRTTATHIATPKPIRTLLYFHLRLGTDRFVVSFSSYTYIIYTHLSWARLQG